jgi:hypothetical protein
LLWLRVAAGKIFKEIAGTSPFEFKDMKPSFVGGT